MKPLDPALQKLLNAAARARKDTPASLPVTVETRVLAHLRRRGTEADDFALWIHLFRRAIVLAILAMALSLAWSYFQNKRDASTIALANYAIQMQLLP